MDNLELNIKSMAGDMNACLTLDTLSAVQHLSVDTNYPSSIHTSTSTLTTVASPVYNSTALQVLAETITSSLHM